MFVENQHIAASKGSENCVLLLLDYGADPNSRGIFLTCFKSALALIRVFLVIIAIGSFLSYFMYFFQFGLHLFYFLNSSHLDEKNNVRIGPKFSKN